MRIKRESGNIIINARSLVLLCNIIIIIIIIISVCINLILNDFYNIEDHSSSNSSQSKLPDRQM